MIRKSSKIPIYLKIAYTLMVLVIVPVYWVEYGPSNFLWFSDIALLLMVPALWLENKLLASMCAVGVLPIEIVWTIDLLFGGHLVELAAYMFDEQYPLYLRLLSLFHIPLPICIYYMILKLGYDVRALWAQTMVMILVIPLSYLMATPERNINWVYGLGEDVQTYMAPMYYVLLLMMSLFLIVYVPTHLFFKSFYTED